MPLNVKWVIYLITSKYIDTHIHLWDLANKINLWIKKDSQLNRDYLFSDYKASGFIPNGVVIVEAASSQYTLDELNWLDTICDNDNTMIRYISYIDMLQNRQLFIKRLEQFSSYNRVVGFRHILAYSDNAVYSPCGIDLSNGDSLLDNLVTNCSILAKYGYILELQLYPEQFIKLAPTLSKLPLKVVFEHALLPTIHNHSLWEQALELIQQSTNLYLKISGMDINHNQANMISIISNIMKFITSNKLVLGSNYPFIGYTEFEEIFELFDDKALAVIYDTSINLYHRSNIIT